MINNTYSLLLYLVSCAVNKKKADIKKIEDADLNKLFIAAKQHSIVALVAFVLEDAGMDSCLIKDFIIEKEKSIKKNIILPAEYNKISNFLTQNKIWHVALKGFYIKDLYPKFGMRQMADIDVLVDNNFIKKINKYMLQNGYYLAEKNNILHNTYLKPPVYNIEVHKTIITKDSPKNWNNYYKDVYKKLIPDYEGAYSHHFNDEDFYIFTLIHAYRHYITGGTGLRSFLDLYIYRKNKKLNDDYIKTELKKLGAQNFDCLAVNLANKIFSGNSFELTKKEEEMLGYIIKSGTYGLYSNNVLNSLKELNKNGKTPQFLVKFKYIFKRLFPGFRFMKNNYTILQKLPFLLPFVWFFRWVYKLICNGNKIITELKILFKK